MRTPAAIVLGLAIVAAASAAGCSSATRPSTDASRTAGQWSGTTSQGMPIVFTVSSDERLTSLTIGYSFNGCSGSASFSGLTIPTAPNVTCIPGPCSGSVSSYRAFGFSNGTVGGARTTVNGVFLPGNEVQGQAAFIDYPGCGSATAVTWAATRQ